MTGSAGAPPSPAAAGDGVDLTDILDDLGNGLVTLVTDAVDPHPAARVVIFDQMSDLRAGDVVLAVGVPPSGSVIQPLIDAAAQSRATALLVKAESRSSIDEIATACHSRGVPLVLVDSSVAWGRLYSLIQASIGSRVMHFGHDREWGVPIGDMHALAAMLSRHIGGPTILEDSSFRVVGYSPYTGESDRGRQAAILSQHIPPEWLAYLRENHVLERLRTTDEVFRLDNGPDGARPRLITSVRADDDLLGIIWVAEGDSALTDQSIERLRQGRTMALPHFRRFLAGDQRDMRRSELLRALIEGRVKSDSSIARLNLLVDDFYSLIAIQEENRTAVAARRELLPALLELYDPRATVVAVGEILYGLAPVALPSDRARLKAVIERYVAEPTNQGSGQVVGAITTPGPLREGLNGHREEARTLLALAAERRGAAKVIVGWEAEAEVLVKRAENLLSADGRFTFSKVRRLDQYDAKHGSQFVQTLATFLGQNQSVSRTSTVLRLHHTTTRYRLQKLAAISSLDLDEPNECIAALLHLLAMRQIHANTTEAQ